MADKNFQIKNGLTVGTTERISSAGVFTGSLSSANTATTQSASDNSTKIATTAYVDTAVTGLIDSAPSNLNTLNELAAAMNDNASFFNTVLPLSGGTMTGSLEVNNASAGNTVATFEGTYGSGGDVQLVRFERGGGAVYGAISYKDATTDMEFGTISSHALSLTTGNTRRLTIDNSGNVGIGTTTPGQKLEVAGRVRATTDPTFEVYESSTKRGGIQWNAGSDYLNIFSVGGDISFDTNGNNVGIGTNSPIAPLHVAGNAVIETGSPDLYLATTSASHTNWRIAAQEVVNQGFEIASGTTSAGSNAVADTYTTRMAILNTGFVGIGENTPSRKLHINGPDGSTNLVEGNSRTALFLDNAGATYMNFASANSSNAGIFFSDTDANNRGGVIYEHANDALTFDAAGTERFRIYSTGNAKLTGGHGNEVYMDIFSDSGSNRGAGYFRFLTDGASAEQSVAQIYMEQGSGDGASRKSNMYFQVADNGSPSTAMTIENNKVVSTATHLNVSTTSTASNAKLNVAGGIRFTHSPASAAGLNVVGQYSFNNTSTSNACGSVYYKMFIINFYHNNGHSQALFLANGGGGVGYRFTSINAGDNTIRNGIQDFSLTTIGSAPNTFRIQISNGGGALTITRTSGSNSFQVSVQALTGG